jgi:dipeptidase
MYNNTMMLEKATMTTFKQQLKQAELDNANDLRAIQEAQRKVVLTRIRELREQYKLSCSGDLIKKPQKEIVK